eukprot:CAMPEP_0206024960 /NCGR_PEP_ID=MMETSP1464-20131121/39157_1 /ASSEMBLY_ACC=CAM_ASM_001124 /TAXON_ID=119497 /ORGANISM="Exanthemachrysis gayraliae, Strain RCC1523" /LENGTH=71 /DNA_ID=CAMNT_0053398987 /DNA_START=212 /DNA_END=424 /DNA_ORIENTATION=-
MGLHARGGAQRPRPKYVVSCQEKPGHGQKLLKIVFKSGAAGGGRTNFSVGNIESLLLPLCGPRGFDLKGGA